MTGKEHPRDKGRSELLGGHFIWDELIKIKGKDLDKNFEEEIKKLKSKQKKDLNKLEKEYEEYKKILSEINK